MYFYKEKGKQALDLKGDLILSFNTSLVKARTSSAGPSKIKAPHGYVSNLGKAGFVRRIAITLQVIGFIWGRDKQLKPEDTNLRESHRANVVNDTVSCKNCKHDGNQSVFPSGCTGCGDSEYKNFEAR